MTPSGLRNALHARARTICLLLGPGWIYVVEVRAGGKSSRVIFANGSKRERIVLTEDGKLAAISMSDHVRAKRVAAVLRNRTKGCA